MEKPKVEQMSEAGVNAAIAAGGKECRDYAIIVIVRPLRGGEKIGLHTNVVRNERVVASILRDTATAVDRGGAQLIEPERRIIIPGVSQ